MRRALLDLLLCPRCRRGQLSSESEDAELSFGPARCVSCHANFPITEGVLDLLGEGAHEAGRLQRGLEVPVLARSYEARLRPTLMGMLGGARLDRESEWVLYRALLGTHAAPALDLGCGAGLFGRKLASAGAFPAVLGLDVSRAMLEEAVAQAREAHLPVDLLRASAPPLPFRDGCLGGALHADGLHYFQDLAPLFHELARVLAPGARYVASTFEPAGRLTSLKRRVAGLRTHPEATLRAELDRAGFRAVERVRAAPYVVFVATR